MNFELTDKNYVITGGASGIGEAIVRYLIDQGARVVIAELNQPAAEALVNEYPAQVRFQRTDVTQPEELESVCLLAEQQFGSLDGIVNCAGIGHLGSTTDTSPAEWAKVVEVDLMGVFHGCRAAIPVMARHGGGVIINIASLSGVRADYGMGAYNAAKAGVINYTRNLALDHSRDGIRAVAVCPGLILTPLSSAPLAVAEVRDAWYGAIPLGRPGEPREIAQLVAFLLSPAAGYITGTEIVIDGALGASNGQPNLLRLRRGTH